MKPHQVVAASNALRERTVADGYMDALASFEVKYIVIGRSDERDDSSQSIMLKRGHSGTGSVNSIGFPDDLKESMTAALQNWARTRFENATRECRELGIEFAD